MPGVRLPAVAVIMGPNGSGKTTLLRALVDLGRIVSSPTDRVPLPPFQAENTRREPTRFLLEGEDDFLAPGETPRRFRYEVTFERRLIGNRTEGLRISHEALVHFPRGRRRRLLERQAPGAPVHVARDLDLGARDDRLKAIRPGRSAIPTLALLNVPVAVRFARSMGNLLVGASNIAGNDAFPPAFSNAVGSLEASEDARQWVRTRIRRSDLGIEGMEILEGFAGRRVRFRHSGLDAPIPLDSESTGTRRLVHLLPMIRRALDTTGLAILDEIDGELHVDMLAEVIRWFQCRDSNPRDAQMLVSSHQVGLLDDLEKEEVFIVEKDAGGATRLYGAQDVRGLRRDVRLYPKYRAGVLGGIPKFG